MPQTQVESRQADFSVAPPASSRIHLGYVDGLRALAALYVVLGHAWLQSFPGQGADDVATGLTLTLMGWLNHGIFAVAFFIAISGFCLMLPILGNEGSLGSGNARRFYLRRARRILPPYYVALLISIALVATCLGRPTQSLFDVSIPMTKAGIISHLLLVHNLYNKTSSNISLPLWSIAVECQIYLVFPLLIAIRRRFGMPIVLAATYLVSVTLQTIVEKTPYWGLKPLYLLIFALGMYAAEVARGPKKRRFIWIGCIAAVLVIWLVRSGLATSGLTELAVGVVAMSVLIVCSHWPWSLIARISSIKLVAAIGIFSYSLYLIHFPLLQLIWLYLVLPLKLSRLSTFIIMATAGTFLIVVLAYGFYYFFERPFCRAPGRPRASATPA